VEKQRFDVVTEEALTVSRIGGIFLCEFYESSLAKSIK
jgi:hypothetical protein